TASPCRMTRTNLRCSGACCVLMEIRSPSLKDGSPAGLYMLTPTTRKKYSPGYGLVTHSTVSPRSFAFNFSPHCAACDQDMTGNFPAGCSMPATLRSITVGAGLLLDSGISSDLRILSSETSCTISCTGTSSTADSCLYLSSLGNACPFSQPITAALLTPTRSPKGPCFNPRDLRLSITSSPKVIGPSPIQKIDCTVAPDYYVR